MAAAKVNKPIFDERSLNKLFYKKEMPEFWEIEETKVTFNMLREIFDYVKKQEFTLKEEILAGRKFGGFGGFGQNPPN